MPPRTPLARLRSFLNRSVLPAQRTDPDLLWGVMSPAEQAELSSMLEVAAAESASERTLGVVHGLCGRGATLERTLLTGSEVTVEFSDATTLALVLVDPHSVLGLMELSGLGRTVLSGASREGSGTRLTFTTPRGRLVVLCSSLDVR